LAGIGVALGCVLTWSLGGAIRNLIYGVDAISLWSVTAGSIIVMSTALSVTVLPSLRAMRADPLIALKDS